MIYISTALVVALVVVVVMSSRSNSRLIDELQKQRHDFFEETKHLLDRIQAPQLVGVKALDVEEGAVRYAPDAEEEYKYADAETASST